MSVKPKLIISGYDDLSNPYYGGGGAVMTRELVRRLKKNFDITVITGAYPGAVNEVINGVQYKRIGIKFGGGKVGQLVYSLLLPFYVVFSRFDLWVESFTPPVSTGFLPLFTSKPVVGLVNMLAGEDMYRKYKLPFHLIESFGLKYYRHFIVSSIASATQIQASNPDADIAIIPDGMNLPRKAKPVKKRHLLFIGRIEINQKGLDLLLSAYKLISGKKPKLVIIGSGETGQIQKLKRLIQEMGLSHQVDYLGRVDSSRKQQLIAASHAWIAPSRFETFSLVCLEALGNKVPLILFGIKNLSWIPEDAAWKVKPFNIVAMANTISRVLKHNVQVKTKTRKGYLLAATLTWDNIAKSYERYLSGLINING